MAKKKKGTGYVGQNDSDAYYKRLEQQGVQQNNPPGTAYLVGSNNLGYGVVAAYNADNQFIGFVRGSLGDGVRVNYNPDGSAANIQMPGDQSSGDTGGGDDKKPPPSFTTGYTPDSIYTQAMGTLAENRARALAAATEGEKGLANDYGLGITQDDTGARFTGTWAGSDANQGGIDPSNPFSRASLLNKSYFTAGKVGEGAYANRGMLTSGAYQRNQGRDAFRFESGKDQLLKQFASGLQGYRDRRSEAQNNYGTGTTQAGLDLFGRRRDEYDRTYPS